MCRACRCMYVPLCRCVHVYMYVLYVSVRVVHRKPAAAKAHQQLCHQQVCHQCRHQRTASTTSRHSRAGVSLLLHVYMYVPLCAVMDSHTSSRLITAYRTPCRRAVVEAEAASRRKADVTDTLPTSTNHHRGETDGTAGHGVMQIIWYLFSDPWAR